MPQIDFIRIRARDFIAILRITAYIVINKILTYNAEFAKMVIRCENLKFNRAYSLNRF